MPKWKILRCWSSPIFQRIQHFGNNLKTGFDFFINEKTTLGLIFTGGIFERKARSIATIDWMDPDYHIDSSINTSGENNLGFKRGGVNLNARHKIDETSEITADLDYVKFTINGDQNYQTQLVAPGSDISATKGNTPSRLNIITAKIDYSRRFKKFLLESGLKNSDQQNGQSC